MGSGGDSPYGQLMTSSTDLALPLDATIARPSLHFWFEVVERWVTERNLSPNTQDAYRRDVRAWLIWCSDYDLDPRLAWFTHVNAFRTRLENTPLARTGRPPRAASVARRVYAIASWYEFLVQLEWVPKNPTAYADKPKIERGASPTEAFDRSQGIAMRRLAASDGSLGNTCGTALMSMLVVLGARVSEICNIDVPDLRFNGVDWTVRLHMKGGKERTRVVPHETYLSVEAYLAGRTDGALFLAPSGARLDRHQVKHFVKRVAKAAGLPQNISPHSFRHAWNTLAKNAGVTIEHRSFQLGHSDLRTTQGYDRDADNLAHDASRVIDTLTAPR